MSARLKLKKLKLQTKFILDNCRMREAAAQTEAKRCYYLLDKNIIVIGAHAEFWPVDTMRDAVNCLDSNVHKVTAAIVHKYTELLAEYVKHKLTSEFMFNKFAAFEVRLLAPALTEDHIEVHVTEAK